MLRLEVLVIIAMEYLLALMLHPAALLTRLKASSRRGAKVGSSFVSGRESGEMMVNISKGGVLSSGLCHCYEKKSGILMDGIQLTRLQWHRLILRISTSVSNGNVSKKGGVDCRCV